MATLHWCFQVDTRQGLECGTISSSLPLLSHTSSLVRGRTATLLYDLTTPYLGKEEACNHKECIMGLVKLLTDDDSYVRSQSCAALMRYVPFIVYNTKEFVCVYYSIAVITKGKYAVLETGAIPHLIDLFNDSSSEVRTNAIKVSY